MQRLATRLLQTSTRPVGIHFLGRSCIWLVWSVTPLLLGADGIELDADRRVGQQLYEQQCVRCHGPRGEGVADVYDETLQGDHSLEELTRIIHETMPEEAPDECVNDEARFVAAYIFDAFYSPTAQARNQSTRIDLSRLTVQQYRNCIADLVGNSAVRLPPGIASGDGSVGLKARYYNARNFNREKLVTERIDDAIDFQFEADSPDPGSIGSEEFAIRWDGSIVVEETGDYEFFVTTENGFRLWINNQEQAVIDGWVSSGSEPREQTATLFLLGGRAYPLKLEYFKYKEKSASIQLAWRGPHAPRRVLEGRYLIPDRVPETLVVSTPFPPDDRSQGYVRGSSVSKAWDEATTRGAIEVANYVATRIGRLADARPDAEDDRDRIRGYCSEFAERAFRRPLSPDELQFFVADQLGTSEDLEAGIKRVVLLVLKSPRFLYPEIGVSGAPQYAAAARLAQLLWDSLPDSELRDAASAGQLATADQIAAQAQRMLADPRARFKTRGFFHEWLQVAEGADISRDTMAFPGFDEELLADLRTSLDLFLDDVVWSERSDFRQILLADYLYLNPRLAKFYEPDHEPDIAGPEGSFEKTRLDEGRRAGVVTHPYLMAAFAYFRSSSPIHRGVFVTRKLLSRALKPPPMAIEFMDDRFDPNLTMREKVTQLTESATCQTCHRIINPLGFSLEHFDAVGRYREMEQQKPIDATAEYVTETGETVVFQDARDLAEFAAANAYAQAGFLQQLFQHFAKQPVAAYGPHTLDRLQRLFEKSDYSVQAVLVQIALTVVPGETPMNP